MKAARVALVAACLGGCPVDPALDGGLDAASDAPLVDASFDAGSADAGSDAGPPSELGAFVRYQIAAGGLAGVAALGRDGERRIEVLEGQAGAGRVVDAHTLFNVASVSKTFVVALALQLAEEGRLDLDGDVNAILGHSVRHPGFPDTVVTTRMLLTHTSGLADDYLDLGMFSTTGDPTQTLDAFTRAYVAPASHWGARPGTRRSYCNAAFGVLGRVVERASGEDLRTRTATRLTGPLGLDGAGWFFADVDSARLATGYGLTGSATTPLENLGYAYYPATGMLISVTGLERWGLGHLHGGEVDGARFLPEARVTEALSPAFPSVSRTQGLGWYQTALRGRVFVGHGGSSLTGSAQLWLRHEEDRLLIVLSNSNAYLRERLGDSRGADAMRAILERLDAELGD